MSDKENLIEGLLVLVPMAILLIVYVVFELCERM